MSKFESFCRNIHKNKHGYVPDLLDLESDELRDLAMAAFMHDNLDPMMSEYYMGTTREHKNFHYALHEPMCQDAIDAYNQRIDDAKNLELIDDTAWIGIIDPDYKWQHFNQAMYDSGHKPSDFA